MPQLIFRIRLTHMRYVYSSIRFAYEITCTHARTHAHTHACMHTPTHACTHTHTHNAALVLAHLSIIFAEHDACAITNVRHTVKQWWFHDRSSFLCMRRFPMYSLPGTSEPTRILLCSRQQSIKSNQCSVDIKIPSSGGHPLQVGLSGSR